ncbi:MAG: protein translocase subunit SecD [Clostridia bacterium]|nr:protein translocase subunit SecD [Clostridia bacterium]
MKTKKTSKLTFFIIFILIMALAYTAFFGIEDYYGDIRQLYVKGANDIRWGIDIKGGVEAIFKPEVDDVDSISAEKMDAAKTVISLRLVNRNITDYEIYVDYSNHQIIVRFPWSADQSDFDPQAEVDKLGASALVTFCRNQDNTDVILSGSDDIESASTTYQDNEPVVQLKLTEQGKAKFAAATAEMIGQTISIWLDDDMKSAPTVNTAITDGIAIISGKFTADSAIELANTINAGTLPFKLTVDNEKLQIISATLGEQALGVMIIAGSIAFGLVCLLMILRYRLHGVIASIALLGQLAGTIACISGFFPNAQSFTLTVPGIAGIILSVGVGVDCNVIAAERIRDEFRKGKTIDGAIDSGFKNSLSAIIDGNVTIVLVSLVLMGCFGPSDGIMAKLFFIIGKIFGASISGSIYAFGYTLLIGVIFNLIMGVLASKYMLKSISKLKVFRHPALYGGKKNG